MVQYHHLLISSTPCSSGRSVNNKESTPPNKQKNSHIFVFIIWKPSYLFILMDHPPSPHSAKICADACSTGCLSAVKLCPLLLCPQLCKVHLKDGWQSEKILSMYLLQWHTQQTWSFNIRNWLSHLLMAEILVPYGSKRCIRLIFTFFFKLYFEARKVHQTGWPERCKDGGNINSILQRGMLVLMMLSEVVLMCERHQGWCVKQKQNV